MQNLLKSLSTLKTYCQAILIRRQFKKGLALQDPEKDGEDFTEDFGDAAFKKKENGKENVVWSYMKWLQPTPFYIQNGLLIFLFQILWRQFDAIMTKILWLP